MAIEGYDLVMLGILAAAAVLGYFKGIVWQIAWIAGIAASGFLALRFSGPLAPMFGQQAPWNRLIAMLAIYVGTSLAVWLVFRVISGAINAIHLSAFDHQLGLLLGIAKGALMCVVVTFFAVTLAPAYRNQVVASRSGRLVAEIIMRADEILPPKIAEPVQPFVKQFEDQFRGRHAAAARRARTAAALGPQGDVGERDLGDRLDQLRRRACRAGPVPGAGSGAGGTRSAGRLHDAGRMGRADSRSGGARTTGTTNDERVPEPAVISAATAGPTRPVPSGRSVSPSNPLTLLDQQLAAAVSIGSDLAMPNATAARHRVHERMPSIPRRHASGAGRVSERP
jgi:membrane protein required for colicin V production